MNQVTIMGNITKELELRYTPKGTAVLKFSIAVNHRVKNKEDKVSYFECDAWDKTAEFISKYWTKGKQILLTGRLEQQSWTKDEVKHYKTVIVVEMVFFTGKKDTTATDVTPEEAGIGDIL